MKTVLLILFLILPDISQADGQIEFMNRGEFKIGYRVYGSGHPLIILNGGPGRSSDSFIPLAKSISKLGLQTILFDQRGTGTSKLSKTNNKTVTLNLMLEDLDELRKELKLEKVSILGHSFGGMYALSYAAKYPSHVKSMILSESPGPDLSWQKYAHANMLSRLSLAERKEYEDLSKIDTIASHLKALRLLAPAYVYDRKYAAEIADNLSNLACYFPEVNQLLWEDMRKSYKIRGALDNFTAPTLIIHGRQDFLGEEVALANHKEIKNSKLEFINESSHYPWHDQPKRYFELIKNFISAGP